MVWGVWVEGPSVDVYYFVAFEDGFDDGQFVLGELDIGVRDDDVVV